MFFTEIVVVKKANFCKSCFSFRSFFGSKSKCQRRFGLDEKAVNMGKVVWFRKGIFKFIPLHVIIRTVWKIIKHLIIMLSILFVKRKSKMEYVHAQLNYTFREILLLF